MIVSHDRYFLENIATDMAELSRVYPDGILRVRGNYSTFLEKKEEFLHAQSKRQEALENLVHNEIEWLRRGAKARTRKSKARIGKANELMGDLADLNAQNPDGDGADRFFGERSQDQAADRTGRCELPDRRPPALRQTQFHRYRRHAGWPGRPQWQRQDHAAASVARRVVREPAERFAARNGCASSTSIRLANLIPM